MPKINNNCSIFTLYIHINILFTRHYLRNDQYSTEIFFQYHCSVVQLLSEKTHLIWSFEKNNFSVTSFTMVPFHRFWIIMTAWSMVHVRCRGGSWRLLYTHKSLLFKNHYNVNITVKYIQLLRLNIRTYYSLSISLLFILLQIHL